MPSSTSQLFAPPVVLEEKSDERVEPLLPEGLWWIYIVGPPLFVAITDARLLLESSEMLLRSLAITYIHTAAIMGALQYTYARVLPRVFAELTGRWRWVRNLLHFAAIAVLVPVATFAIQPIIKPLCWHPIVIGEKLIISYVFATALLLAALAYQRLRKRAQLVERMATAERQAALTAQLRALQARTNPHFLFNSLNAVASLIPKDPARAEETVERLAEVLRYSLQRTRRSLVHLEEELDVVKEYLEIEAVRFGARLSYRIDADPRTKRLRIPPMALQPLVENAVLHGIGSKREGGLIEISAELEGDSLLLSVTDDGPGCGGSAHAGTGTGLEDLRERLRLLYGRDDLLRLERAASGGCRAVLALPTSKR